MELISHVASYANVDTGDALNVCLAVGPKDANSIRHFCLRNNMDYLDGRLEQYVFHNKVTNVQVSNYVKAWMAVNTDWKKHVTDERIKKYKIVQRIKSEHDTESDDDEDGWRAADDGIFNSNAVAIFNNPLVAIEFDLVEPLSHLVEEVGIDINGGYEWNNYTDVERCHPLAIACQGTLLSCFRYLLGLENIDVDSGEAMVVGESAEPIMHFAFDNDDVSLASFEAMASHHSFDANCPSVWGRIGTLPLQYACNSISENQQETDLDKKEEKLMSLLNKFKAHPLYTCPDGLRNPALGLAWFDKDDDPRMDRIFLAMMETLTEDEQEIWRRTPRE